MVRIVESLSLRFLASPSRHVSAVQAVSRFEETKSPACWYYMP
jgi:hypothetical protein